MGDTESQHHEPSKLSSDRHSRDFQEDWNSEKHSTLQVEREAVYDLLNAGPRSRFMVRGSVERASLVVHNCVQAASRDILVESMLRAEDEGYQVVMTVHDEVVSLSDAPHAAVDHFVQTLCVVPPWARGCPIAAAGWSGDRYKKD